MGSHENGLLLAAARGDAGEVRRLLASGADANARNVAGVRTLMVAARKALMVAADSGCAEHLRVLVEAGADIEARDNRGFTPLHVAASSSRPDRAGFCRVECLLSLGADPSARDAVGRTPLMNAVVFGRADACAALLPVSDLRAVDRDGCDALSLAKTAAGAGFQVAAHILSMVSVCIEEADLFASQRKSGVLAESARMRRGWL